MLAPTRIFLTSRKKIIEVSKVSNQFVLTSPSYLLFNLSFLADKEMLFCWLSLLSVCAVVAFGASLEPFSTHPQLQCAACVAVAELVGKKMNDTAKLKTSIQASHRLSPENKVRRINYEESELRAVEILENLCVELSTDYKLRTGKNNLRLFSDDKNLEIAKFFSKTERKQLRGASKRLRDVCYEITDDHDDLITNLIRKERDLDVFIEKLCFGKGLKKCGTKAVEKAKEKELKEYEEYRARMAKKEAKRREKLEAEKLRKEEQEAAKASEEEADSDGDNDTDSSASA